ncbi:MAG: transglycosylase domain-containing protein [Oscillospiraceae bacterium]|nr:transglycosylase domain-containing protein [Oscillospiraceae bacterium]
MFNGKKKDKKQKPLRQDWKPNFFLRILYAVWRVAFGAFKIAAGAACTVLMVVVICGFVFAGVLGDYLQEDILPMASVDIDDYELEQNSYLYYLDSNGNIQKYQDVFAVTSSSWVDFEDIPEDMIHAAVAIEDHRFFEHQGVDWITTVKACARMFFGDDSVGGSSITQQLIKNVLLTEDEGADDVTVQRKVLEIFRAVQLEKQYDKDEILELYLNFIYLGQGCRGIRSAAETYYGKEVESLTAAECASIIGITNSPTWYDPYQNPENNNDRKENILWAMNKYGWLTDEEYEEALAQELVLKNGIDLPDSMAYCKNKSCNYKGIVSTLKETEGKFYCPDCGNEVPVIEDGSQDNYSWFADAVLMDVAKALAEKNHMAWNSATRDLMIQQIKRSGYHIYTTIDVDVQKQVDKIYTDLNEIPETRSGQQLQSAIVVIDNTTGDIVAMAGGVGEKTGYLEWSRATDSKLQSGSSIKPLSIYAPGFEQGTLSPATVVPDLPLNYDNGAWPRNDNYKYGYSSTIHSAVTRSVNAVAAHSLNMIGVNYGYDFAKNKFGLTSLVDEYVDEGGTVHSDNGFAPLAMGAQTWGVHVRDMAGAYATFANNGIRRQERTFTKVYDSEGNLVIDNTQSQEQILSEKSVNYMNYCLINATANGTGTQADFQGQTIAGKTGSTSEFKDRWYCGFTGYYTAAVWTGYDRPEVIRPTSVNPAAVLFKKVMQPLHEGLERKALYDDSQMGWVSICLDSGKIATEACKKDAREIERVATVRVYSEDRPSGKCDRHVTVELCSGGGLATEWCEKFAEIDDTIEIEESSYVRMTKSEYNAAAKAVGRGLDKDFLNKDFIVVGNDDEEKIKECEDHTEEAWEKYLKEKEEEEKKKQEEEEKKKEKEDKKKKRKETIESIFGL